MACICLGDWLFSIRLEMYDPNSSWLSNRSDWKQSDLPPIPTSFSIFIYSEFLRAFKILLCNKNLQEETASWSFSYGHVTTEPLFLWASQEVSEGLWNVLWNSNTQQCSWYMAANTEKKIYMTSSSNDRFQSFQTISMKMIVLTVSHLLTLLCISIISLCFHKNTYWCFDWDYNECRDPFVVNWHLYNITFPIHKYIISFLLEFFRYSLILLNDFL